MHRLEYSGDVAKVSWLFKARAKRPYLGSHEPCEQRGKTADWSRPEGCVENGPTVTYRFRYASSRPAAAGLAAYFEANDVTIICERVYYLFLSFPPSGQAL